MPQCSHASPDSFCSPEWAITKFVSSSLMGMWLLTGSPSFCAAHCSHRCFSIFLPLLISVRCTVAGLLQFSPFIGCPGYATALPAGRNGGPHLFDDQSYFPAVSASTRFRHGTDTSITPGRPRCSCP